MNNNNYNDVEQIAFLPLAMTAQDQDTGCVAGLTGDGCWIRPKPISGQSIICGTSGFRYGFWSEITLGPPMGMQPENRPLRQAAIIKEPISPENWQSLVLKYCDSSVTDAFHNGRTAGIISARILRLYLRRHIGGKYYLRLEFQDQTGEIFDWVLPDFGILSYLEPHIKDHHLEPEVAEELVQKMGNEIFLALGLTLPNDRFPGHYRGCQPLVVGLHSIPDYQGIKNV